MSRPYGWSVCEDAVRTAAAITSGHAEGHDRSCPCSGYARSECEYARDLSHPADGR